MQAKSTCIIHSLGFWSGLETALMARILIFQGTAGHFLPLRNSLQDYHELYFVNDITDAMKVLHEKEIDLIISSPYDDTTDAFSFMHTVKQDIFVCGIPIVCLSKERSSLATHLDAIVEKSALLCGADKYLSMDSFCGAKEHTDCCTTCPFRGELCDYAGLRRDLEDMIPQARRAQWTKPIVQRQPVGSLNQKCILTNDRLPKVGGKDLSCQDLGVCGFSYPFHNEIEEIII
jgi:hypothetical protein